MKRFFYILLFSLFTFWSTLSFSAVSLNIKIAQMINNQLIEVKKTISSDYNKEIIITDDSLQSKIVLTLKKFKNVVVNGNKIEPVQINVKTLDLKNKPLNKSQTVTSFYSKEANFIIADLNSNRSEMNLNLEFNEIN